MRTLRPLFLLLALLCWPVGAWAQTFPPLTGRVVDNAHLLQPAEVQALTDKLAGLEKDTGRQVVVVTLPDLQGRDIADYGYRLGRAWGIGQKGQNNGALLIVAPNERRVRIEVGYGLEGILTDALCSLIIANEITPPFKQGDYAGGINAGVDEIAAQLKLTPEEAKARAAALAQQEQKDQQDSGWGSAAIVLFFVFFFVVLPLFRRATYGGQRYGSGGGWWLPIMLWGAGSGRDDDDRWGGGGGFGGGGFGGGGGGGGFSGGGGSFGGGGASGGW